MEKNPKGVYLGMACQSREVIRNSYSYIVDPPSLTDGFHHVVQNDYSNSIHHICIPGS